MWMEDGLPARLKRAGDPPKTRIVHLGPGAFFRAFNAIYTDEVGDWGILAVSLKSATARSQLEPQGCVYTSLTKSSSGNQARVINSISGILVAPENPDAVVAAMVDPEVKVVSLTVTEKGYCHEPSTGALDLEHPDIRHDLRNLSTPRSAVGFIVAALKKRKELGHPAFTVLSCDNLPSNGSLVRGIVLDFAAKVAPELADWIATNATFPATMVDRITPATTTEDVDSLAKDQGYFDPACVVHEAFRQWVIEDDFVDGRPAWETAGAQMVTSVQEHELMKLRCLNGTHSTLAYLGYLAGYETIADCMADPDFTRLCEKLWQDEITPVIAEPHGEDLNGYCAKLLTRYRDTAIRHRTWQIAMDGSQKLPQRILGTIRDNLKRGHVPEGLCLAVAGWMRYVAGTDENGKLIDVRDPLATRLRDIAENVEDIVDRARQLRSISAHEIIAFAPRG